MQENNVINNKNNEFDDDDWLDVDGNGWLYDDNDDWLGVDSDNRLDVDDDDW